MKVGVLSTLVWARHHFKSFVNVNCLLLTTTLWDNFYYCSGFIGKKTEVQRGGKYAHITLLWGHCGSRSFILNHNIITKTLEGKRERVSTHMPETVKSSSCFIWYINSTYIYWAATKFQILCNLKHNVFIGNLRPGEVNTSGAARHWKESLLLTVPEEGPRHATGVEGRGTVKHRVHLEAGGEGKPRAGACTVASAGRWGKAGCTGSVPSWSE